MSATRWQTSSSRDHCVLNCAIASSRLAAYPRSVSDGLWLSAVTAQNQGASFGACGWRNPADDTVAIAHVEIVITAAAVLVGADKGERSGGSHVTSCGRSQSSNIRPRNVARGCNFKTYHFLARLGDDVKLRRYEVAPMSANDP